MRWAGIRAEVAGLLSILSTGLAVLASAQTLAHVDVAHLHQSRVVHDAVHDRLGRDVASQARVPVLALVLRLEHGRALLAAALHHFKENVAEWIGNPYLDSFSETETRIPELNRTHVA